MVALVPPESSVYCGDHVGKLRITSVCTVASTNSNHINLESAASLQNSHVCSSSFLVTLSVPKKQYIIVSIANIVLQKLTLVMAYFLPQTLTIEMVETNIQLFLYCHRRFVMICYSWK